MSVKIVASGICLLSLAGACGSKGDAPEPTSANIKSGTNTQVIQMPDGFRNVVFTCYGTVGVYVTSRGIAETEPAASGITVLAGDPHCLLR